MLYARAMSEPEKPKRARWGDLIAIGVGTGLIAYYARGGREKYGGFRYTEDWWIDVAVVIGCIAGIAGAAYLMLKAVDAITAWVRRRWAGLR